MQVEELLQTLRDAGMDDEAIKALLSDAIASLDGPAEGAPAADENAPVESDEEKMNRVFGI